MEKVMLQWWRRRREERERIVRAADELMTLHAEAAYEIARRHRLEGLQQHDHAKHRFWSAVARTIAHRTGREVGVDAATRYLAES